MGFSRITRKRRESEDYSSPLQSPTRDSYLPGRKRPVRSLANSDPDVAVQDTFAFAGYVPSASAPVTPPRKTTQEKRGRLDSIHVPYLGKTRVHTRTSL